MQVDLCVAPPDDRDGCLQDVHWYCGGISGGFQSYTVGNILSAQFFAAAIKAHPHISSEIGNGQFATLQGWLTDNIHCHGRTLTPEVIVARATGSPMTTAPYLAYLRKKYGESIGCRSRNSSIPWNDDRHAGSSSFASLQ